MTHCQHCGSKLLKNAKFCHSCGEAVVLKMEACQVCSTLNPVGSIYCMGCGESLGTKKNNEQFYEEPQQEASRKRQDAQNEKTTKATYTYKPIFQVSLTETLVLEEEIKSYFFQALRATVKEISNEKKYSEYVRIFYDSGFNFYFSQRQRQLIKDLQRLPHLYPEDISYQIDLLIDETFETILDRFTVTHTRALNDWQPPDVTRWELIRKEDFNVEKMIFDYLDLPSNDEKHYTNFLTMPIPKLKNAWKSFLFASQTEIPLVISDQTVFGSCREGYAFTNKGIYWKSFFNKPIRYYFEELYDVRRQQDWISINGQYFYVDSKMNYKILKLFKKLRSVFGQERMN